MKGHPCSQSIQFYRSLDLRIYSIVKLDCSSLAVEIPRDAPAKEDDPVKAVAKGRSTKRTGATDFMVVVYITVRCDGVAKVGVR